ncbi:class I SAM-dependent methyltransferase [Salinithrix halophila]|uniref:Class I SAM-dependent methyltransferase n=1 Tax=Salinithrix halophila TaxID=1485204 RepID=A0ABV8JHT6_9BACL
MNLSSILSFTKAWVKESLFEGAVAVDATVGNGNDTLFLAKAVGAKGRVFGFDIQAQALNQTRSLLIEAGVESRVSLFQRGHHRLAETLAETNVPSVQAVMFNLGYLPQGDPSITTLPETTLTAVDQSLNLIATGGTLTLVLYTGHPGGEEEASAVLERLTTLDPRFFDSAHYRLLNRNRAPSLVIVRKKK